MDAIDPILSTASQIYSLVKNVKANKERCCRVADRVKVLVRLVEAIKETDQVESGVPKALEELRYTLESAKEIINKYNSTKLIKRILKSGIHEDEFSNVHDRLDDAFHGLSGALQVEQRDMLYKVFQEARKKDEEDRKKDIEELKELIQEYKVDMERKLQEFTDSVEKFMRMSNEPAVNYEDIRKIKSDELKYDDKKKPFMTSSDSEVYKGMYRGFAVAIKRYTGPVNTSVREMKPIFNKEVQTMRKFESPNILRMFGICVQDEDGSSPQFLIIMEFCAKGSLREVLNKEHNLTWTMKARMCLDAAQGLYRLHQTEDKKVVHGCINSSTFMVDEYYKVKLGGFQLAKTETSLRKGTRSRQSKPPCYSSPQSLSNVNHIYSRECEIYSFGIVMWEVATHQKPFDGCSTGEIYKKVSIEKYQEPLPDDCPELLRCLINDCRTYDSFHRPSAGELMDRLRSMVEQLEKQ